MTTLTPLRTASFIDSLGVNVHLPYTDGNYANVNTVIASLKYLGLDNVRDWAPTDIPYPGDHGQLSYPVAAAAGIDFVFNVNGNVDIGHAVSMIRSFEQKYPGSVLGIEGPNEVNNWAVNFNGLSGDAAAKAFQSALFNTVNADSVVRDIPVLSYTTYPWTAGAGDVANIHPYPRDGDQPLQNLIDHVSAHQQLMPGKPIVITEAGYFSLPGVRGGVDEATQAKLTLNLIFDATKLGVQRTFLYELLDAYADPARSDSEKHFGLFDHNNNPKLAAVGIHNLTTILADNGGNAESFATKAFTYTLGGQSAGVSSLALQKSSGVSNLVIWAEPDIWDEVGHKPIAAPTKAVSVQLDHTYATVNVYDPLAGSTPTATLHNVSSLQVDVVDHPLIIELVGGVAASAAPVAPAPPAAPAASSLTATPTEAVYSVLQARGGDFDGTARAEVIEGSGLPDNVRGFEGDDTINGGGGDDMLNGNIGSDVVHGGDGADSVLGGQGDDTVFGDAGDDPHVNGNMGDDLVYGGSGNDTIYGGKGDDRLFGDRGQDRLSGDLGDDTMTGGADADIFVFHRGGGNDVITDFNSAEGDRIELNTGYTLSMAHGAVVVDIGGGETLTLQGVTMASLNDWLI